MQGIKNLSQIVTLSGVYKKNGRNPKQEDLGLINNGAIVYDDNKILWVGESTQVPTEYTGIDFKDGTGHTLTPEIVDSHTHIVFGGNRSNEYSMRLNGADYQEIANAGGGILSTMKSTNENDEDKLFCMAKERVKRLQSYGIGTIEIKTGYGLNVEKELECARVIKRLKDFFEPRVKIFCTFMPAHAVPQNFNSGGEYLEKVVYPAFEKVKKLF